MGTIVPIFLFVHIIKAEGNLPASSGKGDKLSIKKLVPKNVRFTGLWDFLKVTLTDRSN